MHNKDEYETNKLMVMTIKQQQYNNDIGDHNNDTTLAPVSVVEK